ncbi:MAG: diadenylate cyclase [Desulfocapsaceae bacterium]|nr:diadenylate cyclase [Desulfocapsaceae bacterium]
MDQFFVNTCINDTLHGLREGLSHFSGDSSAAIIFRLKGDPCLSIYDPYNLLRGHELKLENFYFGNDSIANIPEYQGDSNCYSEIENVPEMQIDGLLSFGGCSATVPYQMWFTDHHPDLSSTGPTERWLEHAVLRFSHDIANEADLYTGVSGKFLREYSTYAIHDHITKETIRLTGRSTELDVYPILEAILAISKTREEGAFPRGELVFVPPEAINEVQFMARFDASELPRLNHYKHVRKLLQSVEGTDHKLISDGISIHGVSYSRLPRFSVTADYHGRYGYLRINEEAVCSFSDGRYQSSSLRAKLFEVEEILLDYDLQSQTRDNLFHIISTLVHNAQSMKHGCTFILDLNTVPAKISGQMLRNPIDLNNPDFIELASGFSRVDGALHICRDQHLHSFACLLDGRAIEAEDRARGARFNSALRFTAENPKTVVVVVSVDRPVSVIQGGMVVDGQCQWRSKPNITLAPRLLKDWLKATK